MFKVMSPRGLGPKVTEDAEVIARRFHETYERLAPRFGYETRRESAVPWRQVPERNRKLMVAVVTDLLDKGVIAIPPPCDFDCTSGPCILPKGHRSAHRGRRKEQR